jgi:hypothetical protein
MEVSMGAIGPHVTREAHVAPPPIAENPKADAGNRTPNLLITNRLSADSGRENPHHDTASAGQHEPNRPAKRTPEEWRAVPGYHPYEASSLGRIRKRYPDGSMHVLRARGSGRYLKVCLCLASGKTWLRVHQVIALAFVPGYADGLQVNHIDGDRRNNRPENLEWLTGSENMAHAHANGLIPPPPRKFIPRTEFFTLYNDGEMTVADIADHFGVHVRTVYRRIEDWGMALRQPKRCRSMSGPNSVPSLDSPSGRSEVAAHVTLPRPLTSGAR